MTMALNLQGFKQRANNAIKNIDEVFPADKEDFYITDIIDKTMENEDYLEKLHEAVDELRTIACFASALVVEKD